MEAASARKLIDEVMTAATAPDASYLTDGATETSSCGTIMPPCIAVGRGPRRAATQDPHDGVRNRSRRPRHHASTVMARGLAVSRASIAGRNPPYSLVYATGVGGLNAAEICDAIKNATTTAGTLISLKT